MAVSFEPARPRRFPPDRDARPTLGRRRSGSSRDPEGGSSAPTGPRTGKSLAIARSVRGNADRVPDRKGRVPDELLGRAPSRLAERRPRGVHRPPDAQRRTAARRDRRSGGQEDDPLETVRDRAGARLVSGRKGNLVHRRRGSEEIARSSRRARATRACASGCPAT
jgi:hypothetical protein